MQGLVFDIRRFSVNDGPGIRTTVFLKGCPLHCIWCHNPESQNSFQEEMIVNQPLGGVQFSRVETVGQWMTVHEVVSKCFLDIAFMSESGGGVTLSGGEPLFQPDFTVALVNELSMVGIHVAIDTCGYASKEIFELLLPKVNLWLYDFKGADIEKHKKNIGVKPDLILQNLNFLISKKAEIILRYPVVPGFNDTEYDISALFHLLDKNRERIKEVHLLPYHRLGEDKLRRLNISKPHVIPKSDSTAAARAIAAALSSLPAVTKIGV